MEEQVIDLIRKKKRSMGLALVVALLFYFMLPLSLMFFPTIMNQPSFIQSISWAWLYAFLQIPMTWFFCWLYHHNAKKIEHQLHTLNKEESV